MNKTFCDSCGAELGRYDRWIVTVACTNDPKPPPPCRHATDLCETCAKPALDVIAKAMAAYA